MFSIIMPSFNQAPFIERAIESVLNHTDVECELVITDGGSTDGTLDILSTYSNQHPNINWISEPDAGPAEALNKSLARSRGIIIGWLNSDDCYKPNIFKDIEDHFTSYPDDIMVYGHGEHIDAHDTLISRYPTERPIGGFERLKHGCFICQPTVFFKRSLYLLQGPLNKNYKASFDYEYWFRAFSNFPNRIGFIDAVIAQSRLHDSTITHQNRQTVALEGARLCAQYFTVAPIHWLVTLIEELESQTSTRFTELSQSEQDSILNVFTQYCDPNDVAELRRNII